MAAAMKSTIRAILLWACLLAAAHAEVGPRHVEAAGGFAFRAPAGWQFQDFPGMKFKMAAGPVVKSIRPNIVVVDEAYSGTLPEYADANLTNLRKMMAEFEMLSHKSFVTAQGMRAEKMVTRSLHNKTRLRQTFLFVQGKQGMYYVLTGTAPADGGEALDAQFEESFRTFELLK
jgi:hypothetical protein